ncbi:MAG: L,D-transpeptidase family protein [Sphingomonas sp.]|nr:L,D-transpeptidase family protein [Sphingomonas sp.]
MILLALVLVGAFIALANGALTSPATASRAALATISPRESDGSKPKPSPAGATTTSPASPSLDTVTASPSPYEIKHILPIKGPLHMGDHFWDERGAPDGPMMITVDLAAQTISVFRGGYEIGTAAILYGADDKPTPLGVFAITEKDADHVSNLYDAPMPYMLRMTNDGISIHGTSVADGYMTHGCIGVPTPFARQLFGAVKLGDRVVVTRGKLLAVGDTVDAVL